MKTFDAEDNPILATMCDAAEVSNNGVMWLRSDGHIMGINSWLLEELGYENGTEIPKTVFEINPTLSLRVWRKLWKQVKEETKVSFDSEHITADESIYPVQMSSVLINIEDEQYAMVVTENLMDANRYEELLEFTSRIASIGSWEWDLVKNDLFFSDEMYRLLGLPPESKVTKENVKEFIAQLLSEEDLKIYNEKTLAAAKDGTPFEFDFTFEVDGTFNNFNLQAHPIVFEEEPIKIYGTLQNVDNISKRTDDMYFTKYSMDYARDMIYWSNPDGSIFYANQTAVDKMGYSQEEFLQMNLADITVEETSTDFKEHWKELKEKKSLSLEIMHHAKNGKLIPVSVVANYVNYRGKEFNSAFVRDLTAKKKRDEILQMSKTTLDNALDLIFWAREDGSLAYANKAFADRFRFDLEKFSEMNIIHFIYGMEEERYQKEWEQLKKEKFYRNNYLKMVTATGELFPAEITTSVIKVNGVFFSTTILRDISEREELTELTTMSKHTLDHSLDMIFWLNADGSFRYFNDAFVKKTGYKAAQVAKKKIYDFFPGSNFEMFKAGWDQLKKGKRLFNVDRGLRIKDGTLVPCEINVTMVQFKKSEFSVTVLRDITQRKEKEAEVNRHMEEIERLQEVTEAENIALKEEIDLEFNFSNIITRDPNYKRVLRQVEQVSDTDATVLILGETGTGKELLARAIHQLSERADMPMVKVNCGSLPENLIESELFGHEKGSFTGAHQQKLGKFERADKGTIFLDEMGELPLDLQSKLLRVLQEGEIERVGGVKTLNVDVRIIAATNRNLEQEVANGRFREDLYYRLNVFPIYNIPLRERREDIPILVKHFANKYAKKINREILEISPASMNKLMAYDFLGNVRELENMVERAVILSRGKMLTFDNTISNKVVVNSSKFLTMEEMQREHIIDALRRAKGKVSGADGAAVILDMNDKTLTSRMNKLGIDKQDYLK